ncbi:hypothetical protein CsSME_00024989 [Camellia sinensis var. sinensis]
MLTIKSVLEFSQQQLTMLGVAKDIGENVGILPGIACNKFSPWIVLLIGAFASFLGYGVLWLVVSQTVQSLPYWLLWLALCVATNSGAWLGTAVLITNMRNFPVSRGTVAGILKGYVGLSAAVYTEIFGILLHNSSAKLLLFLTLGIPTLCIVMMYAVKPCTPASGEDSAEHSHFLFIQVAILSHFIPLSDTVSYTFLVIMVLLLMAPLAIPVKMTLYPSNRSKLGTLGRPVGSSDQLIQAEGDVDKSEPLLTPSTSTTNVGSFHESDSVSEVDMLLAEGEGAVKKKRRPKRGEDFTFCEAIVKADIWLLFFVYFASVGSGVTILNNLAQIGIAQGAEDTTVLLSLFSFFNFVGWLGGGIVSEHFVRTIWMTFTQIIMIITYLLFASALDGTLYVATAVLGMCYGFQFLTMVPIISKLFGLKHFGMIFNFMSLGNPLCVLLFSGFLAGFVYDSEAAKQHGTSCLLPNCFRLAFIILAGVCALGTVLSVVLTKRIKPVYEMLYAGGSFRLPQSSNH